MFFIDILLILFTLYIVIKSLHAKTYKLIRSLLAICLGVGTTILLFWVEAISKITVKPIFTLIGDKLYNKLPVKFVGYYSIGIPVLVFIVYTLVAVCIFHLLLGLFIKNVKFEKTLVYTNPKNRMILISFLSIAKGLLLGFFALQILMVTIYFLLLHDYPLLNFGFDLKKISFILDYVFNPIRYDKFNLLEKVINRVMQYAPYLNGGIV